MPPTGVGTVHRGFLIVRLSPCLQDGPLHPPNQDAGVEVTSQWHEAQPALPGCHRRWKGELRVARLLPQPDHQAAPCLRPNGDRVSDVANSGTVCQSMDERDQFCSSLFVLPVRISKCFGQHSLFDHDSVEDQRDQG